MAIFGLGPVFDTLSNGRMSEDQNPDEYKVIATWKGGEIDRRQLDSMRIDHFQTVAFLDGVRQAAEKKAGGAIRAFVMPISPINSNRPEVVDGELISRYIFAQLAAEEGVVASDGMVDDYLRDLSAGAEFSRIDYEAINNEVNSRYSTMSRIRERLKIELLANQMLLFGTLGISGAPNVTEAVQLFSRTIDQVECEVLPVDVSKMESQVTTAPSPAEVKALYEEGKYDFPTANGEKPGFKMGPKLKLGYFVADFQAFLQQEMNELSDEDVQKEYERLVAAKDEMVLEPLPVDDGSIELNSPPPGESDVTPPPQENPETGGKEMEEAPGDVTAPPEANSDTPKAEAPKAEVPKAEVPKAEVPKAEVPKAEVPKAEVPKAEVPKAEAPKAEAPKAEAPKAEAIKQSGYGPEANYQFVSTRVQEEVKAEAPKVQEPKSESAPQESAEPVVETPVVEPTAPVESGGAQSEEAAAPPQEPGSETPASTQEPAPKERAIKPLKDVKEEVKRSMCEEPALEAMTTAITKASVMVQDYYEKRLRWEFEDNRKSEDEPAPLDLKVIATQYKLIAKETGLVDFTELSADTFGSIRVFQNMMVQGRQSPQLIPMSQILFSDFSGLNTYEPNTVDDNWNSRNSYLYWVAQTVNTKIPSLEESESEVKKYWKKQEAFKLAMKAAQSYQKTVNDSGGKLMSEISGLPEANVLKTGAFTWFSSFGSTRFSSPIGVTSAGEEFMKAAFKTPHLEAGVAENESRDTVYVIQPIVAGKEIDVVGEDFLTNQLFKFKRIPDEVQQVSQIYRRDALMDWYEEVNDRMEVKILDR
jgi:hypothetical protein